MLSIPIRPTVRIGCGNMDMFPFQFASNCFDVSVPYQSAYRHFSIHEDEYIVPEPIEHRRYAMVADSSATRNRSVGVNLSLHNISFLEYEASVRLEINGNFHEWNIAYIGYPVKRKTAKYQKK